MKIIYTSDDYDEDNRKGWILKGNVFTKYITQEDLEHCPKQYDGWRLNENGDLVTDDEDEYAYKPLCGNMHPNDTEAESSKLSVQLENLNQDAIKLIKKALGKNNKISIFEAEKQILQIIERIEAKGNIVLKIHDFRDSGKGIKISFLDYASDEN